MTRPFRRLVLYVPGFDPMPPRRYRELYRRESHKQALIVHLRGKGLVVLTGDMLGEPGALDPVLPISTGESVVRDKLNWESHKVAEFLRTKRELWIPERVLGLPVPVIIMFAVFAAFVPSGEGPIKTIAFGLAVGVFVDAFVVRMTLVPAVMVRIITMTGKISLL